MLRHLQTDVLSSWVLIAAGLVLIEILFFKSGTIFSLFFAALLIYFGRKNFHRFLGKIMLGVGLISLTFTILSMFTLKLIVIALVVYWIGDYFKSKKEPGYIAPVVHEQANGEKNTEVLTFKRQQLLLNKWIGHQHTPHAIYEWEDIQLQNGVGDVVIDLSNTVLPSGESVISIRSGVGKVTILVPYELDVGIRHSAILGTASVFQFQSTRLWNESVSFNSEFYADAPQKVKILTSVWVGDLEVKRV
ncbi:cell wall-active antibiotics response protein LiaF [Jeotgalibacillus sp. S-D1]|uniref:cell wall-active antibiotics response protein LiaF n=1 Tax=Jeotgalibacillus sp. S-D1 TaxID=2552189 RepID=UPI0014055A7D|nr:cell wall-active antibiotics response protein LiaF [Jeotgalibacillus sp. S-D1]